MMKIYLVGGAVRDKLLGIPHQERDWVVVGATVDDMLKLGYRQVGKEFPVFLHPQTNEEYALARMERKVEPGYTGFRFDTSKKVTLEQDLLRRDLTINAMAETEAGELIDPYHGQQDLKEKRLRHVSAAFAEDPVRILRVGRFLARYHHLGFSIAPDTIHLMQNMVQAGEVDALVPERVWKELERALSEKNPEQFFVALSACGALAVLFPDLPLDGNGMRALSIASTLTASTRVRFAALLHDLPKSSESIAALDKRYRFPHAYRELARLTALHYRTALACKTLTADELISLFARLDIYRRYDRFSDFLEACVAIGMSHQHPFDSTWLQSAAQLAKSIDAQPFIQQGYTGQGLATQLQTARKCKIAAWLDSNQ